MFVRHREVIYSHVLIIRINSYELAIVIITFEKLIINRILSPIWTFMKAKCFITCKFQNFLTFVLKLTMLSEFNITAIMTEKVYSLLV